jgi:hypothetical protein
MAPHNKNGIVLKNSLEEKETIGRVFHVVA